jgi:8-oxo-dGTP pyrophosphatase MutT (NUDIX family)
LTIPKTDNFFSQFTEAFAFGLKKGLPGEEAQYKMAPFERKLKANSYKNQSNPKLSAVLTLLYPRLEKIHTVLILRNSYLGVHSAQVSFPGGKKDETDISLQQTALRETEEEIGISPKEISIIGEITPLYIPPSGYLVHPFAGYTDRLPLFKPDKKEVNKIIEFPLSLLLNNAIVKKKPIKISMGNHIVEYPYFDILGYTVWGATAMMLSEIKELILREKELRQIVQAH